MPSVAQHRQRSTAIKSLHLLLALSIFCVFSHSAQGVDVFGQTDEADVEKVWTREEIAELKDKAKDDYKVFLKKRDLWSALQLETWIKSLDLDIKFGSILGDNIIGNPLYAFPHSVRTAFDHGEWIAVPNGEQINFIDGEGRPTHPRVTLDTYLGQTGITANRSHAAGMRFRSEGEEPNLVFYYRCALTATDGKGELWKSAWMEVGRPIRDDYQRRMPVAHDGSAMAVRFLAPNRNQDFCIIVRPGRTHITVDNLRNPAAVGEHGNWIIGYNPSARRSQFVQGDKRSDILRYTGIDSYGALLSLNGKALEFINPKGNRKALNAKTNTSSRLWSFDNWLVVQLGNVTEKQEDQKDVFGNVVKKGDSKTVTKTVLFKWSDLLKGKVDPSHEITGNMRINSQRPDSIFSWSGKELNIHDCTSEEITSKPFATFEKNIHKVQVRDNGVCVITSDEHNHMLNYHGKSIYSVKNGSLVMLHPHVLGHYWNVTKGKQTIKHSKIINFTENGDAFETEVPGPKNENEYGLDIHHHGWYARRYLDKRNWLYFDLWSGKIIREGHVADTEEPVRQWGLPKQQRLAGRFNAFGGRLIPKWVHQQQSVDDRFAPRDAMYTRGGLMVITSDEQLRSYDKKFQIKDHLKDVQFWAGRFVVQEKDINTYITSWMEDSHKAKYYIDAGGRLKTIPNPQAISGQRPEGEWKINGSTLYIPRQGQVRFPEEAVGFWPNRLRSRNGVRDLLMVTSSLVIEIDSSTAKKIFSRK